LRRLARTLGAVRDHDVAVEALGKLVEAAPERARAGVERIATERADRREQERAAMTAALEEETLRDLRRRFDEALAEAAAPRRRRKQHGEESFSELGRRIVGRLWEELRELSPSLYRPNRVRRLHRMRIAAKRLRYALELFSNCWDAPPGEAKRLASEISRLQDLLGHLHDCDEWIEEIGGRLAGKRGAAEGADGQNERLGLVWLLDYFAAERTESYRQALRLWHEWEAEGFAARIAACGEQAGVEEGGDEGDRQ
jgi:CHAD domain-containing protein